MTPAGVKEGSRTLRIACTRPHGRGGWSIVDAIVRRSIRMDRARGIRRSPANPSTIAGCPFSCRSTSSCATRPRSGTGGVAGSRRIRQGWTWWCRPGGRFTTVGKLIDHIFLVERRHLQRLQGLPLSTATGLTGHNAAPLFDYSASVRRELEQYIRALDETTPMWSAPSTFSGSSGR